MNRKKDVILRATVALTENYKKEELFMPKNNRELPSRAAVIDVVKELRSVIFPGYFWNDSAAKVLYFRDISVRIPVLPYFRSIMWDTD